MEDQSDLDRIGLFKEMSYLHGQGYTGHTTSFNMEAHKNKQMMTNATKSKCGTQDGYFDKEFARIFEEQGYNDPIGQRRRFILEQAKKNRPAIFKPTSPTKLPSGVGSYYGTFEGHKEKLPEAFSTGIPEAHERPVIKKNFLTNPGKKGTGYGYPNVTISEMPPYSLETEPKSEELRGPKESEKVFILGMHEKAYFDENPFVMPKGYSALKEKEIPHHFDIPFMPPSPAKKDGGMKAGCINNFPEYTSNPYTDRVDTGRSTKKVVNKSGKLFVPVPGIRVYPIRSIIATNTQRSINSSNFKSIKGVVYCKK